MENGALHPPQLVPKFLNFRRLQCSTRLSTTSTPSCGSMDYTIPGSKQRRRNALGIESMERMTHSQQTHHPVLPASPIDVQRSPCPIPVLFQLVLPRSEISLASNSLSYNYSAERSQYEPSTNGARLADLSTIQPRRI